MVGGLKSYQKHFIQKMPVLSFVFPVLYYSAKAPGKILETGLYPVFFIWRVYLHIFFSLIFAYLYTRPSYMPPYGDDIVLFHKEQSYIDSLKMRPVVLTSKCYRDCKAYQSNCKVTPNFITLSITCRALLGLPE